ncbi:hypothetical protein SAOR_00835 [Salinisphaera orenii MK-B5]|uniref:Uncharacterized protein n=1 Tax=Salinisphaera orenii MK-B5 TaxID=856730 RepID=A0A423PYB3_9GAMM|nr:hypothetical protein [Salinisphaera orenii]ROO30586.1 hypothetical protein SAOR_00835 [Salinisphaera orenii MK-B5]
MPVEIVREDEDLPSDYPAEPADLSPAAQAIDATAVWARIEQWIIRRWPAREVQWITEGEGYFVPRLQPAELTKAEQWNGKDWIEVQPDPAPMGLYLNHGTHRLTYQVGEAEPPAPVMRAYIRLAEYWAEVQPEGGATSVSDGDYSFTRSANAVARALQYSGAADLLRRYRS